MDTLITTTSQIKDLTNISDNIDVELLEPHLLIAQQMYIEPILGQALYNDILSKIENNQLTGDTLTLVNDYITIAIAYRFNI